MARWADDLSVDERRTLDAVYRGLASHKPRGWSVVRGLNELVLRPEARGSGRFGVTLGRGELHAAFHDRRRGVWTARATWPAGAEAASALVAWAEGVAADPDGAAGA
jgi:hypothetical protein